MFIDVVLEITFAQGVFLEITIGTRHRIAPIELNGAVGPFTGEAQLTPFCNVAGMAALAGCGEDGVNLLDAQALDWIVFVDKNREGVDRDRHGCGFVTIFGFEAFDFIGLHKPAHGPEIGRTLRQRWWRGGRAGGLDLYVHTRIEALELLGPQGHQVGQSVRTDAGDIARDACFCLIRRVPAGGFFGVNAQRGAAEQ